MITLFAGHILSIWVINPVKIFIYYNFHIMIKNKKPTESRKMIDKNMKLIAI